VHSADETRSLIEALKRLLPIDAKQVAFAAGSRLEGLGNARSDLDLYVVSETADIETHRHVLVGDVLVDVATVPRRSFEYLADRLRTWVVSADPREAERFTLSERKLMVRLLNGSAVSNEPGLALLQSKFSARVLARQKLGIALHGARCIQVDLVGMRVSKDWHSMLLSSQELVGYGIDALLAGYGELNPSSKWRMRLLERLPTRWVEDLPGRRIIRTPVDVLELYRLPDRLLERPIWLHAHKVVHFARMTMLWAQARLEQSPFQIVGFHASGVAARHLPRIEFDVQFGYRSGDFVIGAMRPGARAVVVDATTMSLLCGFDGESTVADVSALGDIGDALTNVESVMNESGWRASEVADLERLSELLRG
jgi:hypothetical protein